MARGSAPRRSLLPRRALATLLLGLASVSVLAGCPPRAATAPREGAGIAPPSDRETAEARAVFADLVKTHNARVALLETLEAPASTVLRYPAKDRVQEDQLDGVLLLATRGRGALELKLLGETRAWLGGDGTRSWIYVALPDQPRRLHIYDALVEGAQAEPSTIAGSGELTLLTPASLRFLLGLSPIPVDFEVASIPAAEAPPGEPASSDARARAVERFEARWSPAASTKARARFTRDGYPAWLEVTDPAGNVIAVTELSDYAPVLRENLSRLAWPRTATRVVINAPRSGSSARLSLDAAALQGPPRRARDRFFDLAEMQLYLAPAEVIYHDPSGTIRGVSPGDARPGERK